MTSDRTLVWIDAREAVIAHLSDGEVHVERLRSDVPSHHRATGHVRYDPIVRHGGVAPQDAGEANRLEHLSRFVDAVSTHLPTADDLDIIGPGTVRDRLEQQVRESDRHASRNRSITCRPAARLTEPQLVARLRRGAGVEPRQRTVGSHRWSEPLARRPSSPHRPGARRVDRQPPIEIDLEDLIEEEPG
jgi:hypothetical protein